MARQSTSYSYRSWLDIYRDEDSEYLEQEITRLREALKEQGGMRSVADGGGSGEADLSEMREQLRAAKNALRGKGSSDGGNRVFTADYSGN